MIMFISQYTNHVHYLVTWVEHIVSQTIQMDYEYFRVNTSDSCLDDCWYITWQFLTPWGRYKMVDSLQKTFSNSFPSMKIAAFWICSQVSNWQLVSTDSDDGLVLNRRQASIWTKNGLACWHIYVSLGLNKLSVQDRIHWSQTCHFLFHN